MNNPNDLIEYMRSPAGSDELEVFLGDFIEWLKTRDTVLCEVYYMTEEFDVTQWARNTYSDKGIDYGQRECPECDLDEFPFVSDDYVCVQCRAVSDLTKYSPFTGKMAGVDPDGYDLWLEEAYDNKLAHRVPCDAYSPREVNPATLAYQYVRYKTDRLTSYQKNAKVVNLPTLTGIN